MARYVKEELSYSNDHKTVNIISVVEELNGLNSQELSKLLRESENFTIQYNSKTGTLIQVDMERLACSLPLHLIAVLVSSSEGGITLSHRADNHVSLKYFLHGLRLLHSLSDLASRHMRFEQIMLDDVRVSEQVLDLVFYMLLVLARYEQDNQVGVPPAASHSALVACSLHLLVGYISSQWQDLVHVLLAHPKVDIFIDVAFDAVHVDIKFLSAILSTVNTDVWCEKSSLSASERMTSSICQHCEASLQFVLSLCQQKIFRDRVLKNKELCKNGGILSLAQTALDLRIPHFFRESLDIVAAISRLQSKVLSILLQLCEAENISYLDEVAGSSKSMSLARSVVLKICYLLKAALGKEGKQLIDSLDRRKPNGVVVLNSMRLADIFSDDSNFRNFFMTNVTSVLAEILAMPHDLFLSSWCSTELPLVEEDAILDYDPFVASGTVLASLDSGPQASLPACVKQDETCVTYSGSLNSIPQASYAQQRTSYLVKILANLHCFVPNICEEQEKDLFIKKFYECLQDVSKSVSSSSSTSDSPSTVAICRNLCSLKVYAGSLIPSFLNEEDVELLSLFYKQFLALIPSRPIDNSFQEFSLEGVPNANAKDSYVLKQASEDWAVCPNSSFIPNHQMNAGTSFGNVHRSHSPGDGFADNDNYRLTQDETAEEQASNQNGGVDINGVSETKISHEVGKLNAMSKPNDLSEGQTEVAQSERSDSIFARGSASGSLGDNHREGQNSEASGLDVNITKGSADVMMDSVDLPQVLDTVKEGDLLKISQDDDKPEASQGEEKQPRKRKRNIMNDKQITLIENVLLDEPEMQRNAALLQSWADKLSLHGSELTPSQLKNWLNNRKARLARAAREVRAPSEGDISFLDKTSGSNIAAFYDSPESGEETCLPSTSRGNNQSLLKCSSSMARTGSSETTLHPDFADFVPKQHTRMNLPPTVGCSQFELGQSVSLVDAEGKEVGRGEVYQLEGTWHAKSLEDSGTCVVSIAKLLVERSARVQHPSEAAGTTFAQAESWNGGVMRVVWDTNKILPSS